MNYRMASLDLFRRCLQRLHGVNLCSNKNLHLTPSPCQSSRDINKIHEQFGVLKDRVLKDVGSQVDKLKHQNAFKLFNIEQKFAIDKSKLSQEMRNLMSILHPDKFVSSAQDVQYLSHCVSALVNDHYRMLSNPYERGKYLLSLISNKSMSAIEDELDKVKVEQNFLSEMLDLREQLQNDLLDDEELKKIFSSLDSELKHLTQELDKDFGSRDEAKILKNLGKMKFIANCYMVAEDRIFALDDL